jgi:golgi apyrase
MATAGMRLVDPVARAEILRVACQVVREEYEFSTEGGCGTHFQVISGDLEGILGWMTVNYLKKGLVGEADSAETPNSYGFLDMGGASAQIAFEPVKSMAAKHSDDLRTAHFRLLDGTEVQFKLFVTSFLGFGANEAYKRYKSSMAKKYEGTISDPCLPVGLVLSEEDPSSDVPVQFNGTGSFQKCFTEVTPLLNKVQCKEDPCLFNGVHAPLMDIRNHHFIGVSGYFNLTKNSGTPWSRFTIWAGHITLTKSKRPLNLTARFHGPKFLNYRKIIRCSMLTMKADFNFSVSKRRT